MEMLSFYLLSIIVGSVMAMVLGCYGIHLVGRKKTLETLMIGQAMQLGIVFGAFLVSMFLDGFLSVHEGHVSLFISLILSICIYGLHNKLTKEWYHLKTEFSLMFIILSIALSHILTALNPLIESHLTRSFVGDIVTASKAENYVLLVLTLLCGGYFYFKSKILLDESIEFGLYGFLTKKGSRLFEPCIFILMCISIHVFGLLFTLGMLLIPIIMFNIFGNLGYKKMILLTCFINVLSVFVGFSLNIKFERLPTSPTIIISLVGLYLIVLFFRNKIKAQTI